MFSIVLFKLKITSDEYFDLQPGWPTLKQNRKEINKTELEEENKRIMF